MSHKLQALAIERTHRRGTDSKQLKGRESKINLSRSPSLSTEKRPAWNPCRTSEDLTTPSRPVLSNLRSSAHFSVSDAKTRTGGTLSDNSLGSMAICKGWLKIFCPRGSKKGVGSNTGSPRNSSLLASNDLAGTISLPGKKPQTFPANARCKPGLKKGARRTTGRWPPELSKAEVSKAEQACCSKRPSFEIAPSMSSTLAAERPMDAAVTGSHKFHASKVLSICITTRHWTLLGFACKQISRGQVLGLRKCNQFKVATTRLTPFWSVNLEPLAEGPIPFFTSTQGKGKGIGHIEAVLCILTKLAGLRWKLRKKDPKVLPNCIFKRKAEFHHWSTFTVLALLPGTCRAWWVSGCFAWMSGFGTAETCKAVSATISCCPPRGPPLRSCSDPSFLLFLSSLDWLSATAAPLSGSHLSTCFSSPILTSALQSRPSPGPCAWRLLPRRAARVWYADLRRSLVGCDEKRTKKGVSPPKNPPPPTPTALCPPPPGRPDLTRESSEPGLRALGPPSRSPKHHKLPRWGEQYHWCSGFESDALPSLETCLAWRALLVQSRLSQSRPAYGIPSHDKARMGFLSRLSGGWLARQHASWSFPQQMNWRMTNPVTLANRLTNLPRTTFCGFWSNPRLLSSASKELPAWHLLGLLGQARLWDPLHPLRLLLLARWNGPLESDLWKLLRLLRLVSSHQGTGLGSAIGLVLSRPGGLILQLRDPGRASHLRRLWCSCREAAGLESLCSLLPAEAVEAGTSGSTAALHLLCWLRLLLTLLDVRTQQGPLGDPTLQTGKKTCRLLLLRVRRRRAKVQADPSRKEKHSPMQNPGRLPNSLPIRGWENQSIS